MYNLNRSELTYRILFWTVLVVALVLGILVSGCVSDLQRSKQILAAAEAVTDRAFIDAYKAHRRGQITDEEMEALTQRFDDAWNVEKAAYLAIKDWEATGNRPNTLDTILNALILIRKELPNANPSD